MVEEPGVKTRNNDYTARVYFKELPEIYDLSDFLYDFYNAHNRLALIYREEDSKRKIVGYPLKYPRKYLGKEETLRIKRIEFASPGIIEFASCSIALATVGGFILAIVRFAKDNRSRKLKDLIDETGLYDKYKSKHLSDDQIDFIFKSKGLRRTVFWVDKIEISKGEGNVGED